MSHFQETIAALQALDPAQLDRLLAYVRNCPGTIYICGNGGSYSTAQHWACDLSKAAGRRAVALGNNGALLTALANDMSYRDALWGELRALHAGPGDVLICLSCSGHSPNVLAALQEADELGMPTILLTSTPTRQPIATIEVNVSADDYGVIEDCHLTIGHWLTEEVRHAPS